MKMLVCISGARHSEEVLEFACRVAKESASRVIILHVQPRPWTHSKGYLEETERNHLSDCLKALPDHLEQFVRWPCKVMEDAGVMVEGRVVESDDPAGCIVDTAESEDADLIVVGATGHKLVEQLFQPSITARILRRTRRPVLVVPYGSTR